MYCPTKNNLIFNAGTVSTFFQLTFLASSFAYFIKPFKFFFVKQCLIVLSIFLSIIYFICKCFACILLQIVFISICSFPAAVKFIFIILFSFILIIKGKKAHQLKRATTPKPFIFNKCFYQGIKYHFGPLINFLVFLSC